MQQHKEQYTSMHAYDMTYQCLNQGLRQCWALRLVHSVGVFGHFGPKVMKVGLVLVLVAVLVVVVVPVLVWRSMSLSGNGPALGQ